MLRCARFSEESLAHDKGLVHVGRHCPLPTGFRPDSAQPPSFFLLPVMKPCPPAVAPPFPSLPSQNPRTRSACAHIGYFFLFPPLSCKPLGEQGLWLRPQCARTLRIEGHPERQRKCEGKFLRTSHDHTTLLSPISDFAPFSQTRLWHHYVIGSPGRVRRGARRGSEDSPMVRKLRVGFVSYRLQVILPTRGSQGSAPYGVVFGFARFSK